MHEIGITVHSGKIVINPSLQKAEEFTIEADPFVYFDLSGTEQKIQCGEKSIAFTYCQVPFIYRLSDTEKVVVFKEDGEEIKLNKLEFEEKISQSIFSREGKIREVKVCLDKNIFEELTSTKSQSSVRTIQSITP